MHTTQLNKVTVLLDLENKYCCRLCVLGDSCIRKQSHYHLSEVCTIPVVYRNGKSYNSLSGQVIAKPTF